MCGIAGFFGPTDDAVLKQMVAVLHHRGPDDEGMWSSADVSLGVRRLSIVDLETGRQPVFNEDRTVVAVFNGEIYNHVELRNELTEKGHVFRSHHSDSEVIAHLYDEHGPDFVSLLNGMFAIALWDASKRELYLFRDRVGIKPLYYAAAADLLLFGSEPKAILRHPRISSEPDLTAIHHFFSFKNIPAPLSAFAAIKQLGPGEMLVRDTNGIRVRRWWRLPDSRDEQIDERDAARRIRELLEDSVCLNMRCDVPFGAYLSGGVDSSAVVAIASRLHDKPLKTFTLVYEEGLQNKDADRQFARAVSRKYGTEHHEQIVRYDDVPEMIDAIIRSFDEPFSGVISTYFLTDLIKKHVKVALSGDGADELFGSYAAHRMAVPLHILRRHGGKVAAVPDDLLPLFGEYRNSPARLEEIAARGDVAAARMGLYLADDRMKFEIYTDRMKDAVGVASSEDIVRRGLARWDTGDPLNQALSLDFETLLPDQVLAFVDRLSMAHSVEVRPPYLDHRLVEFTARLPGAMKIKNGRVKHILKEAVGDLLTDGLVGRPKEGFIMPVNDWLLTNLRPYVEDILSPARLSLHGLLRADAVRRLINGYYAGDRRASDRIWNLATFQLWWERYQGR